MLIPKYWAESRGRERIRGRQVTVRRFGWSDISQEAAQVNADERVQDALARIAAGETGLARRDLKRAYGGSDGVPIREEIVERYGDAIVTRNIYGARCLNSARVLFADIDSVGSGARRRSRTFWLFFVLIAVAAVAISPRNSGPAATLLLAILAAGVLLEIWQRSPVFTKRRALGRLTAFLATYPDWHVRLYKTPAGFRLLVMHRTFDPGGPEAAEFFRAMGTDPLYVRLCVNQRCFRARLTAKPWRMPMPERLRPARGVWPVKPECLPGRGKWVQLYESMAADYAACEYVQSLGNAANIDSEALAVQDLHNRLSRATSGLPLA